MPQLDPAESGTPTVGPDRGRGEDGRFAKGNNAAAKTGLKLKRARLPETFDALEAEVQALLDGSLADDGGIDHIPTRRLSQHRYRAVLHRQIIRLNAALDAHGMFDKKGKLRVLWLSKLESLIREARLLDQSLGLDRRQKNISLDAYLARLKPASAPSAEQSQ